MKEEYIIINKLVLEKRIEELRQVCNKELGYASDKIYFELDNLLSQSTPLIPEIEKAFDEGKGVGIISYQPQGHTLDKELYNERKQNYILNLKLNI